MKDNIKIVKSKRQIVSILVVWMMAATFFVVFVPLQSPTVKGQIVHLPSAMDEDMAGPPYDMGLMGDGVVEWNPTDNHIISSDYTVDAGYELQIPALTGAYEISVQGNFKIDVFGRLITNSDMNWMTKTTFRSTGINPFEGIFFHPGSEGRIFDTLIVGVVSGLQFEPGSQLVYPGISDSRIEQIYTYGLKMDGALGDTNIRVTLPGVNTFDDSPTPSSTLVEVRNGFLNISNTNFISHGPNLPQLHAIDAQVYCYQDTFYNENQIGDPVVLEGDSNGTWLNDCDFEKGVVGYHYIRSEGVSFLAENCSFVTSGAARSVLANEAGGIASHARILNPTADYAPGFWDNTFDNSSMDATGGSSITLQWYLNVYAEDTDGHVIPNAIVRVKDRFGNPAQPPVKLTDATGWAEWFICTELIQYASSVSNFNPFNKSAENSSMLGYSYEMMDQSKENLITVPLNPTPNNPPTVADIIDPTGVQSGPVNITFMLDDLDIPDDGNLSITVEFWDPIALVWKPATKHPSSGPTSYLNKGVYYTFVWASNDLKDLKDKSSPNVKIRITPYDKAGPGTPLESGTFTVDNLIPTILTGPFVTPSDTWAKIQWTVDEPCDAHVWYGLDSALTTEVSGSIGSTTQEVNLTSLQSGRRYSFVINSTDAGENKNSSYNWLPSGSGIFSFDTLIHIQLYKGWNMISLPPILSVFSPNLVLSSIAGEYDAIQWYDANDNVDPWKHNKTMKPFGNDLDQISSEMGIWIHMKNDAVLIHDNIVPTPPTSIPIQLLKGWNFVAYPSLTTRTVNSAMGSITFDIVWNYDVTSDTWSGWDGGSGNLINMELGKGYWIHVPSDDVWYISYY